MIRFPSFFLNVENYDNINFSKISYSYIPGNTKSQQGIYDISKFQSQTNNISVYFIKRNGAFIGVQEILSSILTMQLNPKKQIYFYLTNEIDDNAALGTNNVDYENLAKSYPSSNFRFSKIASSDKSLKAEDLQEVISKLKFDQKIDLFIEDRALVENNSLIVKHLTEQWVYINSITFPTDGSYNLVFNKYILNWFNSKTRYQLDLYLNQWIKLFNGSLNTSDSNIDWVGLANFLPIINSNKDNTIPKVNIWNATNKMFKEYQPDQNNDNYPKFPAVTNPYGLGLKKLWNNIFSDESREKFKKTYKMSNINFDFTISKTNYIFMGSKINETATIEAEFQKIMKFHDSYDFSKGNRTIIYKGHPRETKENLDALNDKIQKSNTNSQSWFYIINHKLPVEVYLISGFFNDDQSNKTFFKFNLDAASTTAQVFYDYEVSKEQIIFYIFNTHNVFRNSVDDYGLKSTVIDFAKSKILISK